jgi:hypothetical protein
MNRPLLGLLLGLVLGAMDGGTAFFSAPELRPELAVIVMGSTMKGVIAGLVTGIVTRKMGSLPLGALTGMLVALVLAAPIAHMNAQHYGNLSYYWKIILPGMVMGVFVGYATVRYGRPAGAGPAPGDAR